jgi:hypothetical protein
VAYQAELEGDSLLIRGVQAQASHGEDPPAMDVRMRRVTTETRANCPDDDAPPIARP